MTGPEGGFNPKYNSFDFDPLASIDKNATPEKGSVSEGSFFSEFSPEELKLLDDGPMNQVGWFTGFDHADFAFLPAETKVLIRDYVNATDPAVRKGMVADIVAGIEKASDAAYEAELKKAA